MLDVMMSLVPEFLESQSALKSSFCADTKGIWSLVGAIVWWVQIAIPILIILLGTIDLGKAVISGDDKKIQAELKSFIMRLIYGAAVFFVAFVVRVVFGAIGEARGTTDGLCWKCVSDRGDC